MPATDQNVLDTPNLDVPVMGDQIPLELLESLIDRRISMTVATVGVGSSTTRRAGTVRTVSRDHAVAPNRSRHTKSVVIFDGNVSTSFLHDDSVTITMLLTAAPHTASVLTPS